MRSHWLPFLKARPALVLMLLAAFSTVGYLSVCRQGGYLGFALDDAWIHQTYARNLAQLHQFAFVPGQASAGSTSPLWTGLVAVGYFLNLDYRAWTYLLGTALLGMNAWLAYRLTLRLWPERVAAAWVAGVVVALEWHMIWAAVSGMETLLFIALVLAAFVIAPERPGWLGVCVGFSVLARPDGLSLLPFIVARLFVAAPRPWRRLGWAMLRLGLGFACLFLPYLGFNYALAGTFWPNTFYAKQAEYAVLRQLPLLNRIGMVGLQPLVGATALLVPGGVVAAWQWVRRRGWEGLLVLGWVGAYLAAYVVRLPAVYQHGRYLMPVIPAVVVIGVGGTAAWLRLQTPPGLAAQRVSWPRLLSRTWAMAFGLVGLAFWGMGARAYQTDVRIIETEMVQTAHWINGNTPSSALLAAHDIGALGYFGGRRILDMAGLISPDVVPLMGHDAQLRAWLLAAHADYLVLAPGWGFPGVVHTLNLTQVYKTETPYSRAAGGENMVVYRLDYAP